MTSIKSFSIEQNGTDCYVTASNNTYDTTNANCDSLTGDSCNNCVEAFSVGGFPQLVENDIYNTLASKYDTALELPELGDNCKETDCVIFNAIGDYNSDTNKITGIRNNDMKCIEPIGGSCLPSFQGIVAGDENTGQCKIDPVYMGTPGIINTINGSTTDDLCLDKRFNNLDPSCETKLNFKENNYRCPWIGYSLFNGGVHGKGVDGTYTFNIDKPTNPYWCFSDSDTSNMCKGTKVPNKDGQSQDCSSIKNPSKKNCNQYYQQMSDNTYQNCILQGGVSPSCNSDQKKCTPP